MIGINRKNRSLRVSLSFATKRQIRSKMPFSQCVSQLRNESSCAAKWHSCAKNAFAAAKYPRRDFYSVAEWFCSIVLTSQRQRLLQCCGMVLQHSADFAEAAKSRRALFFALFLLCFCSVFAPISIRFFSFQFPCNFFHLGSFKKIKIHIKT